MAPPRVCKGSQKEASSSDPDKVNDDPNSPEGVETEKDEQAPDLAEETVADQELHDKGGEEEKEVIEEGWDCLREVLPTEKLQCRKEGCEGNAAKVWIGIVTKTEWPLCQQCEDKDFKDDKVSQDTESPPDTEQQQEFTPKGTLEEANQVDQINIESSDDTPSDNDHSEEEEKFELIDFIPFEKLKMGGRVCDICIEGSQQEHSLVKPLLACTVWQAKDPKSKKWYYCLDCQQSDFEGFPSYDELLQNDALRNLDPANLQEHFKLMKKECSRIRNPVMPTFPSAFPSSGGGSFSHTSQQKMTAFVTPPPKSIASGNITVAAFHVTGGNKSTNAIKVTPKVLATQKKWQEQAEAMGGIGAKIIVNMSEAKEKIFLALRDAFRPMNITEIYQLLKATVPQPVLSSALKDMSDRSDENPFERDSDDEEDREKAKKKDLKGTTVPFGPGSLVFKPGRNANTSLYFVNYLKLKALENDDRQSLFAALTGTKAEFEALKRSIALSQSQTAQLLTEPTNDEIVRLLKEAEDSVRALEVEVPESRKLQVNEGTRIGLQKKIQKMVAQWGKRKRICLSFLSSLEEITDGSITIQKSLAGDGPLQLDSDEVVEKAEITLAKQKAQKRKLGQAFRGGPSKKIKKEVPLDSPGSTVIAVRLLQGAKVERVYFEDDAKDT